ncbi:MAG: SigE family RNA polymerase sigma factor [Austwickia sp.]|nr:SigE family RNA polymerase sigma factor [Actinomycetota bacterium]MCO5308399.1 SigE family RNA polymerase sigma factor [Austwickia sp.]
MSGGGGEMVQAAVEAVGTVVELPMSGGVEGLYRAEYRHLVRYAYLLMRDLPAAEDAVQDAFIALQRRGITAADDARAYLHVVILNASRGRWRRAQRDRGLRLRLVAGATTTQPAADAGLPRAELVDAVNRLPRRQREVIALRYWADLPEKEIAAALGISVGTVKTAASRGLAALARELPTNETGGHP